MLTVDQDQGMRKVEPPLQDERLRRLKSTAPVPADSGGVVLNGKTLTSTVENAGLPNPQAPVPTSVPTAIPVAVPGPAPITHQASDFGGAGPVGGAVGGAGGVGGGPGLTPTDPANPLTTQTIGAPSALDRFRMAQEQFDTYVQGTDPAYQAALRDAKRAGAAAGGLGSGALRTSIGDLGLARTNAMDTQKRSFLNDALLGTVDDARFATGVTQQQQGFQSGQQQQAFLNELARLGFDDQMLNSAFGRALQTYMQGQSGGTGSGTSLAGAGSFGQQGQDALTALANLIRAQQASGGATPPTTPTGTTVNWSGGALG